MKKTFLILLVLFLASAFIMKAVSQVPQQQPNTYVHDYAGILTADEKLALNRQIKTMDTSTSVQGAIVIVNNLPEKYATAGEFGLEIGRQWKVGNAENGWVFVHVLNTKKTALEIGRRLEGSHPDIVAKEILVGMRPYLKASKWAEAYKYMLNDIAQKIDVQEQKEAVTIVKEKKENSGGGDWGILLGLFGVVGVIGGVAIYKSRQRIKKIDEESNRYAESLKRKYPEGRPGLQPPTGLKPPTNLQPTRSKPQPDSSYRTKKRDDEDDINYVPISFPSSPSIPDTPSEVFGVFGGDSGSGGFGGGGAEDSYDSDSGDSGGGDD